MLFGRVIGLGSLSAVEVIFEAVEDVELELLFAGCRINKVASALTFDVDDVFDVEFVQH